MILEDVVAKIYRQLKPLTALPIYKNSRPKDATGQYFVINCLGVNEGESDQPAVVNINGYTPDIDGESDSVSLKTLTGISMQLDGQLKDNLNIYFKTQRTIQEAELNCHYSNVQFGVLILND